MKKTLFLVLLLLSVSLSVSSKTVYAYTREGGKFNFNLAHGFYIGFGSVVQTVVTKVSINGNEYKEIHVSCKEDGILKCDAITPNAPPNTHGHSFDPLIIDEILTDINASIEGQFKEENILKGSTSKKVSIISVEGERCTLFFNVVWNLDERGDGSVVIEMDEIEL